MISNKGERQMVTAIKSSVPRGERASNRTSAGLRNALFDEIDALRRGDGDPQKAQAVAKLAMTILYTAKLEHQIKPGADQTLTEPLLLGDNEERGNG